MIDDALLRFIGEKKVFLRIYRLPEKLTAGYCFGGGVPITFINVDWFESPASMDRDELIEGIRSKEYIYPDTRYLVLGDDPNFVFTIEPEAPHV